MFAQRIVREFDVDPHLRALYAWILVAAACLVPVLLLYALPGRARLLRSPDDVDPGPRTLAEVGLVFFVVLGLTNILAQGIVHSLDLPRESTDRLWWSLLIHIVLAPAAALATVLIPRHISGTRADQLGVTTRTLRANICLGYFAWLLVTPLLLLLFWAVLQSDEREPHQLERLLEATPTFGTWMLVLAAGLIVAPVLEELLYRGVAQPWLSRQPWAADCLVGALFLLLCWKVTSEWWDRQQSPSAWQLVALGVLGPLYAGMVFTLRHRPAESGARRGLFAASALFAALHPWPSPIPLFFLGLVLGRVRQRTGSLVAPIVIHFLFNLVALLPLVLTQTGVW